MNDKTTLIDLGDIWALIYYGELQTTLGKIMLNHAEGQNYELKKLALDARMEYLTRKANKG